MDTKKVISTTLMFLVILASVVLFKSIFGDENTLVGIAGITAALSLLGTDYTLNPIRNTVYFVTLEVVLGVAAFMASLNAVLALIITFCVIFYTLYMFTYNTKKPIYIAFTLGYCFMLYTPVTFEELPLRLAGLVFCGLSIMLLQLLSNRNRLKNQIKAQMQISLKSTNKEISLLLSKRDFKEIKELNSITHENLKKLMETLYEVIDKGYSKLSMPLLQSLFIAQFLNSLNIELNNSRNSKETQSLDEILNLLSHIEKFTNNEEDIGYLLEKIDKYLSKKDSVKSKSYLNLRLKTYVYMLKKELNDAQSEDVSEVVNKYFIQNTISKLNSFKNNINKESLKFTFAFRGALVISLGVFIVSILNLEYGKWLVFSLVSVVQPYLDSSKAKGYQRVWGTIIGFVIFEVVFSIITDTSTRTMIILLVGYLNNYQKTYRNQMICTTISALGSASIGANIGMLGFERLILVFIGSAIALYANKFILPYKVGDATKLSIKKSINFNKDIISTLYKNRIWSSEYSNDIKTLVSINQIVNKLIDYNNGMLVSKEIDDYVYNQHIFMNEIRVLEMGFEDYNMCRTDKLRLSYDIDYLTKKDLSKKEILDYLEKIDDNLLQFILINLLKMKENLSTSKNISKLAIKSI